MYFTILPEETKDDFHFWKWTGYHKIARGGLIVNNPILALLCSLQTVIDVLAKIKEAGTVKAAEGIPRISGELSQKLSGYPELMEIRKKYPTNI